MTATKKKFGFRIGEKIPNWTDKLGVGGGKIIKLIHLKYCNKFQIIISNGDCLTTECLLQDDFFRRKLNNKY